jgi:dTDP-4-amino-4,6-dideoxygalactose transaminase
MTNVPPAIPMFDPRIGYATIREEIESAVRAVLESGQLILGPQVRTFEEGFARFLASPGYATGVGNGTDALAIALRAVGVGPGDEVITVPNTAIPTVSAIRMVGAIPVFVDVSPTTWLMDVECVERRITQRTKAIIPVHLFGNAVPMRPLVDIASRRSLDIIEDCAQSVGTLHAGKAPGTFGTVGCFSFYPTKNLGAYGDGGLCFTAQPTVADVLRQLRSYGCAANYYAEREGVCSRLDELQAAILNVKLRHLPQWIQQRRAIARQYNDLLLPSIVRGAPSEDTVHSYQLFVIQTDRRARLIEELRQAGIGWGIHYPTPIHLMRAYRFLGYHPGDFPVAERLAERVISLPCDPSMTPEMVARVCEVVNRSSAK